MTREEIINTIVKQKPIGLDNIKQSIRKYIDCNEEVFQQMLLDILYRLAE